MANLTFDELLDSIRMDIIESMNRTEVIKRKMYSGHIFKKRDSIKKCICCGITERSWKKTNIKCTNKHAEERGV